MKTSAVVMDGPGQAALRSVTLSAAGPEDVVVDIDWSSISAGTERLLWSGRMPPFPGMGYPLVPGYESVGRVIDAGPRSGLRGGEFVFVPGARCFTEVRGLFGGAAARLVVPGVRVSAIDADLGERGALLSLAATAYHALADANPPELIVGNGVLGRLLSRVTVAFGHAAPTVWESQACRRVGASVIAEVDDDRRDYRTIYDASGDSTILDTLVTRLARGGEIVLAGFYHTPLSFTFPPAFMREARFRIAAEFRPADLAAVQGLIVSGALSLDDLITHRRPASEAQDAYTTAFGDPDCVKMIMDWRNLG
ncbi:MAG: chlorophyll synthesis pathway protein BchC [Proteobacteria bacterium]|nr:chlorophyll synthesis pathway protein BchC [Pseudomonadota bacterium]